MVLAELLADERVQVRGNLAAVFAAFDHNRRERGQWLVGSSRFVGDSYEWRAEGVGDDFAEIEKQINHRNGIIADYDVAGGCQQAKQELYQLLEQQSNGVK